MTLPTPSTSSPWYRDGLRFGCTRCGHCCTGAPGYVWVSEEEIVGLAEHLGVTLDAFSQQFVRRVGARYSLRERPGGDCVLWDREQGCTVYEARPGQCRAWPFWPENLESPSDWEATVAVCPGSGQGAFFDLATIEANAALVARTHPS